MTGRSRENYNRNYIEYVNTFAPPTKHFKTCGRAFLVGGFICCIGQFLRYMLVYYFKVIIIFYQYISILKLSYNSHLL